MSPHAARRPGLWLLAALTGSQLLTALGDNALLIAALALLAERGAATWTSPTLRICLYLSYVALAPFAGALADRLHKGRLIGLVNLAKLGGCLLLAARVHPLVAFGVIGLAGVCHGPAKYGILAEFLAAKDLVLANACIEVATVSAIIGGSALGAALLAMPLWVSGLHTVARQASLLSGILFAGAALCAIALPATTRRAMTMIAEARRFGHQLAALWRDPEGGISLAVTAMFWAVAAVLQFLVIHWAQQILALSLGQAALLQCCLAVGVVAGSVGVVRFVAADDALQVVPAGVLLGLAIVLISQVTQHWLACVALGATGIVAGAVVVPMNALLQRRGATLMGPGASIAVQAFIENAASLVFLAAYGLLLTLAVPIRTITISVGASVICFMGFVMLSARRRLRRRENTHPTRTISSTDQEQSPYP